MGTMKVFAVLALASVAMAASSRTFQMTIGDPVNKTIDINKWYLNSRGEKEYTFVFGQGKTATLTEKLNTAQSDWHSCYVEKNKKEGKECEQYDSKGRAVGEIRYWHRG